MALLLQRHDLGRDQGIGDDVSLRTRGMHGRQEYQFLQPSFEYDEEPDYLISNFKDEAFEPAQRIIELFSEALDTNKKVKSALDDCMTQLGLPHSAPLSACIHKIKQLSRGCINLVDLQPNPPQLQLRDPNNAHQHVVLACNQLNEVLALSFRFANDQRHDRLQSDRNCVNEFRYESDYMLHTVEKLNKFVGFCDGLKQQAKCFISDFVDSCHQEL